MPDGRGLKPGLGLRMPVTHVKTSLPVIFTVE